MRTSIILTALLIGACSPSGKFDSDQWKDADPLTRDRVEMVDQLLSQHPLKGLSRSEVVELLGEPTSTDKWDDWDMMYVLGPTDYMPIDNEWLVINLNAAGRVVAYKKTQD
jgi:outer membrane protein assembly factor BamE (lipoprotein component of BamABCDE complex)